MHTQVRGKAWTSDTNAEMHALTCSSMYLTSSRFSFPLASLCKRNTRLSFGKKQKKKKKHTHTHTPRDESCVLPCDAHPFVSFSSLLPCYLACPRHGTAPLSTNQRVLGHIFGDGMDLLLILGWVLCSLGTGSSLRCCGPRRVGNGL